MVDTNGNELNDIQNTWLSILPYLNINEEGRQKLEKGETIKISELEQYLQDPGKAWFGDLNVDFVKDRINEGISASVLSTPAGAEIVAAANAIEKFESSELVESIENSEIMKEIETRAEDLVQNVLPGFDIEETKQGFDHVVHDVATMDWIQAAQDVGEGFAKTFDSFQIDGNETQQIDGFQDFSEDITEEFEIVN